MKFKHKYYTPKIKEFKVGFVFEYWEPVDDEGWIEEVVTDKTDMDEIKGMLKKGSYRPIRVKNK